RGPHPRPARRRAGRGRDHHHLRRQPRRLPGDPELTRTSTMQPSDLKNLNIAVVGAGYAGAAAAKALSLLGAQVNVYEQASRIRAGRIVGAFAQASWPRAYFERLTATAEPIMKEAWPEIDTFGEKTRLIHRCDFIEALLGVLPEGMVHLGHKLETVEDEGDRARLTVANGRSVTAELVVGADGIKSVVRGQLFGGNQPVFAGEHAYRAVISADDAQGLAVDDNLRMYIGRGTKVYFLPLRHRNQVSFDITALCPDSTWAP